MGRSLCRWKEENCLANIIITRSAFRNYSRVLIYSNFSNVYWCNI